MRPGTAPGKTTGMPGTKADLDLSLDQLRDVRDALTARLTQGLAEDGGEIRAIRAHLPPPPAGLTGEALVVDTGGTNMRAALVRFRPDAPPEVYRGPVQAKLPVREGEQLDAAEFYRRQAALATKLDAPSGLPVGYCFSYPSDVLENRDARLIRWTKGVDIPGVEGELVGTGLKDALTEAGLAPTHVAVLNDTVASLLAGSMVFDGEPRHVLGLIAGTGTNMAGYHDGSDAPKLKSPATMAINYESGNFDPPHLCAADDVVDQGTDHPGQQRLEKALSGYYLPFIWAAILGDAADLDPHEGTGPLVELRDNGPDGEGREVARLVLQRSADLVAAALAGAGAVYDAERIGILAEGTLFWRATGYVDRVQDTLRALAKPGQRFEILSTDDANLIGAAVAALVE